MGTVLPFVRPEKPVKRKQYTPPAEAEMYDVVKRLCVPDEGGTPKEVPMESDDGAPSDVPFG